MGYTVELALQVVTVSSPYAGLVWWVEKYPRNVNFETAHALRSVLFVCEPYCIT